MIARILNPSFSPSIAKKICLMLFTWLLLTQVAPAQNIIAEHTAVDKYATIPQAYIDIVKTWLADLGGESHSSGYRIGLDLLAQQDPRFAVTTFTGAPPAHNPADPKLRFGSFRRSPSGWQGGFGESTFYTNAVALDGVRTTIQYCQTNQRPLAMIGFGWCWDMTWHNAPGGTRDAVQNVRWAGSSEGGPQGDLRWGLDAADQDLTLNSVNMGTYLQAMETYRQYCQSNGYATIPIFTTGPVDGNSGSESGMQREIKHDYMRTFVLADINRVLFDYADILCWSNAGQHNIVNWNDGGTLRPHAQIHSDNMLDLNGTYVEDGDHIGQRGALRLAKAMWWLLARLAGWDGNPNSQTINLVLGWNWISFNMLPADLSLNAVFNGILSQIEQVKTQSQSTIRSNETWKGDLADMSGSGQYKMYKVKVSATVKLTVMGTAIDQTTAIQLQTGWNWVAYLPTTSMSIAIALASINGQVFEVKSLTQSATYNGTSWNGTLTQLEPGQGYAIRMSAPGILTYPAGK